jgi:hypothetical protein
MIKVKNSIACKIPNIIGGAAKIRKQISGFKN